MDKFNRYNIQITLLGVFLAAFFLPIKTSLSNIGLILIFSSSILSFFTLGISINNKILKSPLVLYIPLVIGILYTQTLDEATHQLIKYLFLLTTPLLLFRKDLNATNFLKTMSYGLVIGSLVSSVYLISINLYNFVISDYSLRYLFSYYFTSNNFTAPFKDLHPIYLGSYYLFGIILLFKVKKTKLSLFLKILFSCILLLGILFCNSRVIFITTVIYLISLPFILNVSIKRKVLFMGIIAFTLIIFFSFFKETYVYNKFVKVTVWELTENVGTVNIAPDAPGDSRMSRWIVGWEAFKEKPIFGYGTGMESKVLMEKYRLNNMELSLKKGYNSHNQYLSYHIRFGIIGGLFVFCYVFVNGYLALRRRDTVYFGYILIVGTVFLVENYIDRNMGISFVALFGTLFLLRNEENNRQ